jgi:hypothetical protein
MEVIESLLMCNVIKIALHKKEAQYYYTVPPVILLNYPVSPTSAVIFFFLLVFCVGLPVSFLILRLLRLACRADIKSMIFDFASTPSSADHFYRQGSFCTMEKGHGLHVDWQ